MTPDPEDRTTSDTRAAEEQDARVQAHADRSPTADEERIAEAHRDTADDGVAAHYEEMAELGAEVRGEGQIES
jgi:hypothetical protein